MMWVFHLFDENNDGTIEMEEIEHILEGCNTSVDSSELATLFTDMDTNKDGKIDINEFTSGCRRNNVLLKNVGLYQTNGQIEPVALWTDDGICTF